MSRSSKRSTVRSLGFLQGDQPLFLFSLEVRDLLLVLPGRLGGCLCLDEIGLLLSKDGDFVSQLGVPLCKGCERLLQGADLRLLLAHPLAHVGVLAPAACEQRGGQHNADRHRTK